MKRLMLVLLFLATPVLADTNAAYQSSYSSTVQSTDPSEPPLKPAGYQYWDVIPMSPRPADDTNTLISPARVQNSTVAEEQLNKQMCLVIQNMKQMQNQIDAIRAAQAQEITGTVEVSQ